MKHFGDRDTHFEIIKSETSVAVDGFRYGEPTGEVKCEECGQSAMNIDEIPHDKNCPNRFCHSFWYREMLDLDGR